MSVDDACSDPTARLTNREAEEAKAMPVAVARLFLEQADRKHDGALPTVDMLAKLGVARSGRLTAAGEMLFVAMPQGNGIDYLQHDRAVGTGACHSLRNIREPLLKQIYDIEAAFDASNPQYSLFRGLTRRTTRSVPRGVFREALTWALTQRSWASPATLWIEHNITRNTRHTTRLCFPTPLPGHRSDTPVVGYPEPSDSHLGRVFRRLGFGDPDGRPAQEMTRRMWTVGHGGPKLTNSSPLMLCLSLRGGKPDVGTVEFWADVETPNRGPAPVGAVGLVRYLSERSTVGTDQATLIADLAGLGINADKEAEYLRKCVYGQRPVVFTRRRSGSVFYYLGKPTREILNGATPPSISIN